MGKTKDMEKNYNIHFEHKKLWINYDSGKIVKNKIKLVLDYIPNDIESIIDIGCGNGIITNELSKQYKVVGVDTSKEALKYLKCDKINSSSENIPVDDLSFDMVFSSELLEHLPTGILLKTIDEFKRIAKKYIFITIPNQELLEINFIKCPKCGYIFHSYGHLNSFSEKDLIRLIGNNFKHIKTDYFGPEKRNYNRILLRIKQYLGNRWFPIQANTIWTNCQNTNFIKKKGNIISKICNGLNLIFSKKKPYWLFIIFERKEK